TYTRPHGGCDWIRIVALKRAVGFNGEARAAAPSDLGSLATDASGQLDVLGHDGDSLGVDGAEVGVLEESDEVRLGRLLQSHDCRRLEAEVGLEVLRDLANETLEGQLADEKLRALLVATDLTQSHRSGAVAMGLLDSSGGGRRLASGLGGQLLAGSLA